MRRAIVSMAAPEQRLKNRQGPLRMLVFGGSLGAAHLNEVVPQALAKLTTEKMFEVRHQAGSNNLEQARANYAALNVNATVDAYIDDTAEAYAWADIVICRAGAMTIAELAAAGVASILVPYPYAVDDHQTFNARYLSDADAAVLLPQKDFTAERLLDVISDLNREKIINIASNARRLGMPESTRLVTEQCLIAAGEIC